MPPFRTRHTWVALDMAGCPNRCRHCWLGALPNSHRSIGDLRQVVNMFRTFVRTGETSPYFERVDALTWLREPDFHPKYQELYEIEKELNNGHAKRFDLLSTWRLAHDKTYARWAREIGTEACQISFFGITNTHDWFCRRRGAFHDNLVATCRLLDAGIFPQWQLFFTKRMIPELAELLRIADRLHLNERSEALGGDFVIFLKTPAPDGEAWNIEYLRPTIHDLERVPSELIELSEYYLDGPIGEAESILVSKFLNEEPTFPSAYEQPEEPGFYVTSNYDVFSNVGELAPWWKLGNLKTDSLDSIVEAFETDKPLGLYAIYNIPQNKLAQCYGRYDSDLIYDPGDLLIRWIHLWCNLRFASVSM